MLELDKKKFTNYIKRLDWRITRTIETNEKPRAKCAPLEKELKMVEREKATLQEAVDQQGLTPGDIDHT